MKCKVILVAALCFHFSMVSVFCQGTLLFDTHVEGFVDAKVVDLFTAVPLGPEFGATLKETNLGPAGLRELVSTTFSSSERGYVVPKLMIVQDRLPGEVLEVQLDVWHVEYPNVHFSVQSGPVTLGTPDAPGLLTSFRPATLVIPEPGSVVLLLLGMSGFMLIAALRGSEQVGRMVFRVQSMTVHQQSH